MQLPPTAAPIWRPHHPERRPMLTGRHEADVVVIGAGIVGLTTAVLLARAGRSVLVLEAREVGAGTTGRTTAKVSALQGLRYRSIDDRHGEQIAAAYARAQIAGLRWLTERAITAPAARLARARAVSYSTSATGARAIAEELAAAQRAGLPVERVRPDLPFPTTAAIGLDEQAQIDPAGYLAVLAEELDDSPHASVHEGTRVQSVRGLRGHHEVRAPTATAQAPHVVVATLLPILDRGMHFARAHPTSSYLVALRADGEVTTDQCLGIDQPTRSVRTAEFDDGWLLLVGGEGHDTGRGAPTLARYEALAAWAADHFAVGEVVARWSAHDYEPVDGLPWVGPASPLTPNVLIASGFQKWGMTAGTAAAIALADRVLGEDDGASASWSSAFDPHRTTPRSVAATARLNAVVAGRMVGGWARRAAPGGAAGRTCTHLGGVCSWNDGDATWDCPLHGSRFDADGEVLAGPATTSLPGEGWPGPDR